MSYLVSNPLENSGPFIEDSAVIKNKGWDITLRINFVEIFARRGLVRANVGLFHVDVNASGDCGNEACGSAGSRRVVKLGHLTDVAFWACTESMDGTT
jgi:hypothetical protein